MGNGNVAPILDVSSKQIYQIFVGLKQISPSAKQTLTDKYSNTITEWEQEPITRSIQLPCVRATAFSQVGLFLDLSVFPVKISVSDDVHIKYTSFHKWNVGQALSDLNEFWRPYSLSACSYSIKQKLFLLKTRFPTIQCVLIACCSIYIIACINKFVAILKNFLSFYKMLGF